MIAHKRSYGQVYLGKVDGKKHHKLAHIYSYELANGPVPSGLVLDHLCENGLCVRPDHLNATTNVLNIMRGNGDPALNALKTHCYRGHELIDGNLFNRADGHRACKECAKYRIRSSTSYIRKSRARL